MDELEEIRRRKMERMMREIEGSKRKSIRGFRVAVPTMGDRGLDELVCEHFGRAPTFTIVDLSNNEVKVLQNTSEHFGGSSLPPEILSEEGVEVVLCAGLGPRAIRMFESFGIEVYIGASGTVRDAIRAFQAGMLREATDADACKMHRHH
ncbi:MAG: NifB/NifX family molybdenum-iron cluster-binding protein [Candidatus Methanospirareceae archaeon]